jgi:hypothetical protein
MKDNSAECPDSAGLMELARIETGLDDFGDARLLTPLEALVHSFQQDAWPNMTAPARQMAVTTLVGYLAARLRVIADRKRHPEMVNVKVGSPFIVVGPPRSGSTLLHTLLSLDPDNVAAPHWVCLEPSPPPALGKPSPERLAAADARLRAFFDQIPNMYVQHAYLVEEGANALGECGSDIMVMAMTTKALWYYYPLDSYLEYLLSADHGAALAFHHDFLQHVQWGRESQRWALKGADHMVWLRELHAQYPDARLLWTHRDLAQLLGSVASVFHTCRGISGPVPEDARRSMAREAVELERRIFLHGMEARDAIGEGSFCDVSYHDMMADPVVTVQRIYERFGLKLGDQAEANVRAWVAANPQTKHGVHQHSPQDFGLDADDINRQFARYRERFGFGFGIRPPLSV